MNLCKRFLVLILIIVGSIQLSSQSVFLELGGPAGLYSINYDTRFTPNSERNGLGVRVGVEFAPDGFVAPLQLNYLIGTEGKYLDLGIGFTIATGSFDFGNGSGTPTATVKYRSEPLEGGFTWSVGLTAAPNIISFPFLPSISGGYAF